MHKKYLVPDHLKSNILFKNIFVKKGNSERSLRFIINLYSFLRVSVKRRKLSIPKNKAYYPVDILDILLNKLKPGFILRRIVAAGKPYMLPVPISERRATFLACAWLKMAILKDTKGVSTIPQLMLKEILNLANKKGAAFQALIEYIKVSLDQRPFHVLYDVLDVSNQGFIIVFILIDKENNGGKNIKNYVPVYDVPEKKTRRFKTAIRRTKKNFRKYAKKQKKINGTTL